MSIFGRSFGPRGDNGHRREPETRANFQLPSRVPTEEDWGSEARPIKSNVWLVVKLSTDVEEGQWKRYKSTLAAEIRKVRLAEADSGLQAIQDFYLDLLPNSDAEKHRADGRYVAIDFYGGERVEALVTGDWKADVKVAPPVLGPP